MNKQWISERALVRLAYIKNVQNNLGKVRPILVIRQTDTKVLFFRITSQYTGKSAKVRKLYTPMKNWKRLGLNKPSYIDIASITSIDNTDKNLYRKIGYVSKRDSQLLNNRLNQFYTEKDLRKMFNQI